MGIWVSAMEDEMSRAFYETLSTDVCISSSYFFCFQHHTIEANLLDSHDRPGRLLQRRLGRAACSGKWQVQIW